MAPVSVAALGEQSRIAGEAMNLSVAGMLVRSAAACAPGSEVFCDVALPDGVSRLKGRVTRLQTLNEGTGMAIQFLDLTEQDAAMLHDLVERRSLSMGTPGPGPLPSVIIADDIGSDLGALTDNTEVGPAPVPVSPRPTWFASPAVIGTAVACALGVAALAWFLAERPAVEMSAAPGGAVQAAAPRPSIVPPAPQLVPPPPVIVPTPPRVVPIDNPVLAAAVGQLKGKGKGLSPRSKRPRPPAALTFDPSTQQYRLAESVALDLGGARLTNVAGLSAIPRANLRGIDVAVIPEATEMRVELAQPEADSQYGIQITPSWKTVTAISEKTAAGFTIKFGSAAPESARIDWFLVR
jgi:hypothetical protein